MTDDLKGTTLPDTGESRFVRYFGTDRWRWEEHDADGVVINWGEWHARGGHILDECKAAMATMLDWQIAGVDVGTVTAQPDGTRLLVDVTSRHRVGVL